MVNTRSRMMTRTQSLGPMKRSRGRPRKLTRVTVTVKKPENQKDTPKRKALQKTPGQRIQLLELRPIVLLTRKDVKELKRLTSSATGLEKKRQKPPSTEKEKPEPSLAEKAKDKPEPSLAEKAKKKPEPPLAAKEKEKSVPSTVARLQEKPNLSSTAKKSPKPSLVTNTEPNPSLTAKETSEPSSMVQELPNPSLVAGLQKVNSGSSSAARVEKENPVARHLEPWQKLLCQLTESGKLPMPAPTPMEAALFLQKVELEGRQEIAEVNRFWNRTMNRNALGLEKIDEIVSLATSKIMKTCEAGESEASNKNAVSITCIMELVGKKSEKNQGVVMTLAVPKQNAVLPDIRNSATKLFNINDLKSAHQIFDVEDN